MRNDIIKTIPVPIKDVCDLTKKELYVYTHV